MRNVKRIAICLLALMLVGQVAFASLDITGVWAGNVTAIGYKFPSGTEKIYGVIDGNATGGNIRIVIPNIGSAKGLIGSYQWVTRPTGDNLVINMSLPIVGVVSLTIPEADVVMNKDGTKLNISGVLPKGLGPFKLNLKEALPKINKVTAPGAKVGVTSQIKVKTTIATDYIVMADKNDKVLGFSDTIAGMGAFSYAGWVKGANVFRFYAGNKNGVGQIPILAKVGDTLSADDKGELSSVKKFTKKAK